MGLEDVGGVTYPERDAEASRRFLAEEKLHYQQVELPGGVSSPGHDRTYLDEPIFGSDFSGQSLLDIGSSLGYFCIGALRRGGIAATGIEPDRETHRQSTEIAKLWGLEPEYVCADFEDWDPQGRRFDVVTCLNVLHHSYDPVHAIRRIMKLARRKVVLELPAPTLQDIRAGRLNPLSMAAAWWLPSILLGDPERLCNAGDRSFLFSGRALKVVFNRHSAAFEPLRIRRTSHKGRMIVEARKRDIGHLVVVAGPTSSGKSTLVERLAADTAVRRQLGLEDGPWTLTAADTVEGLPTGRLDHVLFHYDFLCPFGRSLRTHRRDPALHLLQVAEKITFVTLIAPVERLREQMWKSKFSGARRKVNKRRRRMYDRYAQPGFLESWYQQWFDFCDRESSVPNRKLLLLNRGDYTALPPTEWRGALRPSDRAGLASG